MDDLKDVPIRKKIESITFGDPKAYRGKISISSMDIDNGFSVDIGVKIPKTATDINEIKKAIIDRAKAVLETCNSLDLSELLDQQEE